MILSSARDLEGVRMACRATARALEYISAYVEPGIKTDKLNDLCHEFITNELRAIPASLNYKGFPKSVCISVNNVVCHGIPHEKKLLCAGDIVNIDVAVILNGYYGDSSCTFLVGNVSAFAKRLVKVTQECLYLGMAQAMPGNRLGDIGAAIQTHAEKEGFSVVKDYCGHGVGKEYHARPSVLHYGKAGTGEILQLGMCFTVEPMINAGAAGTRILSDGWTVVTEDNSLSAQWEHTVLLTEEGCEILTRRHGEEIPVLMKAPSMNKEDGTKRALR